MRKTILFLMILVFFHGGVAHSFAIEDMREENLDHLKEEFNSYEIPEQLGILIGDETINVRVEARETEREVGLQMQGTTLDEISVGGYEDASLEANLTEDTLDEVTSSDKPLEKLDSKLNSGEIEYRTSRVTTKIKIMAAETVLSLKSMI